ncbi:MAG: low molecular weight phosphotyrosine protein phosphatase [Lachnospiraceae bacterium]|nr:low molecular weight phosphotyrosine protein phosphatase [Lachnospiraceae bacterium]
MIKVLFVCHGNTCRSPMAESIFTYMVKQKGLEDEFVIDSAGTSVGEMENEPHRRTQAILMNERIPLVPHKSRQMVRRDYDIFDCIIGMDKRNTREIMMICAGDPEEKIHRLLEFIGSERDVADPFHTGEYEMAFYDIKNGLEAFMDYLL